MRHLLGLLLLLTACALAEEPAEVRRLKTVLAPGYAGDERLFAEVMYVGPFLWRTLRDGPLGAAEGPVTEISPWGVQGKALQAADARTLEAELRRQLAAGFRVRPATEEELALYGALVPYPTRSEPIYVAEGSAHRYLFHFLKGAAFAVDDYQEASIARLDELEAERPPWPLITDYPGEFAAWREGRRVTERGPFTVLLLTPQASLERRVSTVLLGSYVKRLQSRLQLDEEPRDLVIQVELSPLRAVTILGWSRPEADLQALLSSLRAVETPYVRGRVVFQLLVRLNGGTGQPLGP